MDVALINEIIHEICIDVAARSAGRREWRALEEEDLFYEAAVCILGSRTLFEASLATAGRLRELGLLRIPGRPFSGPNYLAKLRSALSEPISPPTRGGARRPVRPRFRNRMASLLAETATRIYGEGGCLLQLLRTSESARSARRSMILNVSGFGPKQASLFLRRVGYCSDLAVLDTHVIDYLRLAHGLSLDAGRLGNLSFYEKAEERFLKVASGFGCAPGPLDIAIWLTMRVAKREAYL